MVWSWIWEWMILILNLFEGVLQMQLLFKGLIHVDLYLVMRRYMTLERYTLERVYYELFGEEKSMFPENTSGSTGTVIQLN